MTPKQQERIRNKIKKIKLALAADKKLWGGYHHDGQGLRYLPPQLYLELNDFTGGLRYFNWFNKNFPDDSGFPDFLFEWTVILFSVGKLKEAERKAFETFCSNTYLFDAYFGIQVSQIKKWEGSNLERQEFAQEHFCYNNKQENLADFSLWLAETIATDKFIRLMNKYIDIRKRLAAENDIAERTYLGRQERKLIKEF